MTTFSEAIKLKDGFFYNLSYHQDRVSKTVSDFYKTRLDLSVILELIPPQAKKGLFKCRVLYDDKIQKIEFIPYTFRKIKRVAVVSNDDIDYSYKYTDRSVINDMLGKSGCDDIIIVKNGVVTDASSSSLVFKSSEGLYTPKNYLLPGTKRKMLLDGEEIMERSIGIRDIKSYEYIYLINAMVDLEDDIKVETSSLVYT